MINSVGLIGVGRFGKVLGSILNKGFNVKAYDVMPSNISADFEKSSLDDILQLEHIFIAVPIRYFEQLIKDISKKVSLKSTIIDVCSVKKHTSEAMLNYLPKDVGIISSHPMFGPDSFESNKKLKMMMDKTRTNSSTFNYWRQFFKNQNINIIEMSPDEHDLIAARTQGVTHLLGRTLKKFGIQKTKIDTKGFRDLIDLVDQTCNDTWELYSDLQLYNPHTNSMLEDLKVSLDKIEHKLKEDKNE